MAVKAKKNILVVVKPVLVPVEKLILDSLNPRLSERDTTGGQDEIIRTLWREMAVDEIAWSIANNGYFEHEPLIAEKLRDGKFLVIEGNRRLAAVRLLLDDKLRRKVGVKDLPKIEAKRKKEISSLPVVESKRSIIWPYVGFKHVNGPQPWESSSKAHYIALVHNKFNIPLDQIAKQIGDQHSTVRRLYRGLMVLEQAEKARVFSRDDRSKKRFAFSHLYTGLDYLGFQRFIGLAKDKGFKPDPVSKNNIKNLGELCIWLYGCKSKNKQPIIQSQNPDLRNLDEVLQSKDGIAALRAGMPLKTSLDISRGDERLFHEALIAAKQSLQEARGKLLTGFKGDPEVLEIAKDIRLLANNMVEEMETYPLKIASNKKGR